MRSRLSSAKRLLSPARRFCACIDMLESRLLLSGAIDGVVTDLNTQATLAGVWVTAYQGSDPNSAGNQAWNNPVSVQTDEAGQYNIPNLDPRHYHVSVYSGQSINGTLYYSADLYDVVVQDNQTTDNINLQLGLGGTISGHAYGHLGNPLSSATVLIKSQSDSNWQGCVTDPDGKYDITVPAVSQPTYQIELASGQDSKDGTYHATLLAPDLYAAQGDTPGPDFNLANMGSIAGTVTQWNTQTTLSGINVSFLQSSNPNSANDQAWNWVGQVPTDGSGHYAMYGLDPRHYRVRVNEGQAVNGTHYLDADLFDVVALQGATTDNMNLQLRPAGVITGHVYSTPGTDHPVPYAHLIVQAAYVSGADNNWRDAWTDSNGKYSLYLPATDQQVYPIEMLEAAVNGESGMSQHGPFYATQIAPGLYSAAIAGTSGPDFHLSLGGAIRGRVLTADGTPVAELNIIEPDTPIPNGVFHNSTAQTDHNGNFWVDSVPANTDIYLRTDDWNWRDFSADGKTYAWGQKFIGPFRVSAGQTLDIGTLTVPRAGTIHGVVTDANGNPVVGAEVDFKGTATAGGSVSLDKGDSVHTDSLGQYNCNYLPPGQYTVRVLKTGWIDYTSAAPISIASNDIKQNDVVLKPASDGATISGAIANIAAVAPRNAAGTILPFSLIDNYDRYNRGSAPGIIVYPTDASWTISDMVSPDLHFTAQQNVTDGWDSYFVPSATPAGQFQINLPTGKQTIQAMCQVPNSLGGWSIILSDPTDINAQAGQVKNDLSLTVPMGTAQITGQLSVPAGYSGYIGENDTILFLDSMDGTAVFGRAVATPGHDGRFSIGNVPAGNYLLYAYGRGLGVWTSTPITLANNQTVTQNITMTYGGVATGTVTSGGNPVSGVMITSQATGLSATTNDQGVYTLRGLLAGNDTLTAAKAGLASQSTGITLASGQQKSVNFDLVGSVAALHGSVRNASTLVGGATVIAYNTVTGQSTTATTVAGVFDFQDLTPGTYVLGARAQGMSTATYPGGATTLTLAGGTTTDLATLSPDHIELSSVGPSFSMSSTASGGGLAITFFTDMALNAMPAVTPVIGTGAQGTLGTLSQAGPLSYTCQYTPAAGQTIVKLQIAEDAGQPVVPGVPASKTFAIDIAPTLVEQAGTTFYNAAGASTNMMGAQDVTSVYVPPFALAGDDATTAVTLTATRYGDPGTTVSAGKTVTGVYEFSFTKDGEVANVHLAHQATITLSFKLPAGMSQQVFQSTLKVGYFNQSLATPVWVWNDMANSNPSSGITNIQINWVNNTITFSAAHFTRFTAAAGTFDVTMTKLPVTFRDADGTNVVVSLTGGTAKLKFTGQNMSQKVGKTGIVVSGTGLKLETVLLSGTTAAAILTVTTQGGKTPGTVIGAIQGSRLAKLVAGTVDLNGAGISMSGGYITDAKIGRLLGNAGITMGVAAKPVSITCGAIGVDSAISVAGTLQSLATPSWTSGSLRTAILGKLDVAADLSNVTVVVDKAATTIEARNWIHGSLTAGSIGTFTILGTKTGKAVVGGNMGASITLTGPAPASKLLLTTASIPGSLTGNVTIPGNAGTITLGKLRATVNISGAVTKFTTADKLSATAPVSGIIGQIHVGAKATIFSGTRKITFTNSTQYTVLG